MERIREKRDWVPATASAGVAIALLGAWVFFVPLVGPYFDFGFHTDETWRFFEPHWTLSLAPGVVAGAAGLLIALRSRRTATLGSFLAALAGGWLILGPFLYPLATSGEVLQPIASSESTTALLWVGYYEGSGALVVLLAGLVAGLLGRARRVADESALGEPLAIDEDTVVTSDRPLVVR
jgi:hypothetical protein